MEFSTTAFNDASLCLKKYQYRWVDGLVRRPQDVSTAMRRGIWLHRALEYYHQGFSAYKGIKDCYDWAAARGVPETVLAPILDECIEIIRGYIAYWEPQSREQWGTLAAEHVLRFDLQNYPVTLKATLDHLVRDYRGDNWVVEHKSTVDIPGAAWRATDPQTLTQFVLAELHGFKPRGIVFNYLLTKPARIPRVRLDGLYYANAPLTTTELFNRSVDDVVDRYDPAVGGMPVGQYIEKKRTELAVDGAFYQRYYVDRPVESIRQTMRDLARTVHAVQDAERANHYRRLNYLPVCRMCPYQELCAAEYVTGRESKVRREELFMIDTGEREGR